MEKDCIANGESMIREADERAVSEELAGVKNFFGGAGREPAHPEIAYYGADNVQGYSLHAALCGIQWNTDPGNLANTQPKKERRMQRTASAVWRGGLKDGKGTISSQSGVLKDTQYSFSTRFESGIGTNPEELIAAAHAGCFTMALSAQLGNANLTPESLETTAEVKFEKTDDGFAITAIHLTTRAKVPGASDASFETAAQNAKNGCPISRLFKGNTQITLDAKLV
jgi:osmotically inducible protein OsmC